jgi:hypothetical protein
MKVQQQFILIRNVCGRNRGVCETLAPLADRTRQVPRVLLRKRVEPAIEPAGHEVKHNSLKLAKGGRRLPDTCVPERAVIRTAFQKMRQFVPVVKPVAAAQKVAQQV